MAMSVRGRAVLVMKQSNKCTGGCATPPPTIGLSNRARAPMIPASYNRSTERSHVKSQIPTRTMATPTEPNFST